MYFILKVFVKYLVYFIRFIPVHWTYKYHTNQNELHGVHPMCSLSPVTHLGGQPALDVQGEGGGDVGVVACVVHKYNLIKKR